MRAAVLSGKWMISRLFGEPVLLHPIRAVIFTFISPLSYSHTRTHAHAPDQSFLHQPPPPVHKDNSSLPCTIVNVTALLFFFLWWWRVFVFSRSPLKTTVNLPPFCYLSPNGTWNQRQHRHARSAINQDKSSASCTGYITIRSALGFHTFQPLCSSSFAYFF